MLRFILACICFCALYGSCYLFGSYLAFSIATSLGLYSGFCFLIRASIFILAAILQRNGIDSYFREQFLEFQEENITNKTFLSLIQEVWNDPTIALKDKNLFILIHCLDFFHSSLMAVSWLIRRLSPHFSPPYTVKNCIKDLLIMAVAATSTFFGHAWFGMSVIYLASLLPIIFLEGLKYPLIKWLSPLHLMPEMQGINLPINQLDLSNLQNVHTREFEDKIIYNVQKLIKKYGSPPDLLDEEFADYLRNSSALTSQQKQKLQDSTYKLSKTGTTFAQAINLVLITSKNQRLDLPLIHAKLLGNLQDGIGLCPLGIFNRIIYSLHSSEPSYNFPQEMNLLNEKKPEIIAKFFKNSSNNYLRTIQPKLNKFLNELYDNNESLINLDLDQDIKQLLIDIKNYLYRELYKEYFMRYGENIRRGEIKQVMQKKILDDPDIEKDIVDGLDLLISSNSLDWGTASQKSSYKFPRSLFFASTSP